VATNVRLLGTPSVAGGEAILSRGRKPWAIVAYLVVEGRPVHRDTLSRLLFGNANDPAAALRWNLAVARRLVGDRDSLRGNPLSLPPCTAVDVATVLQGRWRDAIALADLGSELLEGLHFGDSPEFEMWLIGARRRISAATEAILDEAALVSLAAGNGADTVEYASKLVALDPLNDAHQELLVRSYAAAGDEHAARRQLEAAVRLFRSELGCDPAPGVFLAVEAARAPRRREPSAARTRALLDAGQAQVTAGAGEAALRVLGQACDEAAATGDLRLQAAAQFARGAALIDTGIARHQEAEVALYTAIRLARQTGDQRTAAAAFRRLAASDLFRGVYGRALARLDQAEALHDHSSGERVELSTLRGVAVFDLGERAGGLAEMHRAVDADPGESHQFLPILLTHLGRAYLLDDKLDRARQCFEHAHQLATDRAWAGVTPGPLALLGHIAVLRGDLDRAAEILDSALEAADHAADPCWETWAAHGLARLATARGDLAAALERFADTDRRSSPDRGGHLWSRVWALSDAAALARAARDPRADPWHTEALAAAQRSGMRDLLEKLGASAG
jgi:DNA-binding SARP family transcriptional activator